MYFKNYKIRKIIFSLVLCIPFLGILSCGGGSKGGNADLGEGVTGPMVSGDPWAFRGAGIVGENKYLIGGPLAQGRTGDVLLQNDKIRVIIQKPRRNAGMALYGGNIIDADMTRGQGEAGQDNFGFTFPLINVSWTPFYKHLEVLNADFANGPVIIRATGILDVYDYIQTSIIKPFAKLSKQKVDLFFPDQFNDSLNPFQNIPKLRNVSTTIVTDYILKSDRSYLIIQTHLFNTGSDPIPMPIGDWVNGSGTLETFIPGKGFTGQGQYDRSGSGGVSAIIYTGMETSVGASYGYFYDPTHFTKSDGTINPTGVLTVSGVSIVGLGEQLIPGVIPTGSGDSKINFELPPGETNYVRYFAVGNGDASSVLSAGYQALGVPTYTVSGKVMDSGSQPVAHARVIVIDSSDKAPASVAYSDASGNFSISLSNGVDKKAKMFGSGTYTVEVYKEGYLSSAVWGDGPLKDKKKAGSCDLSGGLSNIRCNLGQSGTVQVSAKDENGKNIPARVGVIGFDPSPFHNPAAEEDQSIIADINFQAQQYGYLDTLLLDANGNIGTSGNSRYVSGNTFRLEPGDYEIAVSRGPEYSMQVQRITVTSGANAVVNATLRKVVNTAGYISGDFHIHGINSPDSPYGKTSRVLSATAEGLDLMVSSDHDAVTDYAPAITSLGMQDQVTSIAGDEITPMAFGHFIVFPLKYNAEDPMGGAFDYTKKDGFVPGPDHHEVLSPAETLDKIDQLNDGEQVRQVAHIMDNLLGNFFLARLITTTKFAGVNPLSSFADPVQFRLSPNSNSSGNYSGPFPFGTSTIFTDKFTALELCIGDQKQFQLFDTALPTWFNFLNLGKRATATCSSDSHRQLMHPLGMPRNFVRSSVDPRDGQGSYSQVNPQDIAHSINQGHVIVTNGPFVAVHASSSGSTVEVGDTLTLSGGGNKTIHMDVNVQSPDWMDWDTIEIYVNTDPTPGNDDSPPSAPWTGTAEEFVTVKRDNTTNHVDPKYIYDPIIRYKRGGGGGNEILTQSVGAGARSANIQRDISINEDSWIVVMVRSSSNAHSIFPYSPIWVNQEGDDLKPQNFLNTLDAQRTTTATNSPSPDKFGGNKAFAFTNPVYVDIDGNGWQAKYIRSGVSPLAH